MPVDYVKRPPTKIDYTKAPKPWRTQVASIQGPNGTFTVWQLGRGPTVLVTLQCPDQAERPAFNGQPMTLARALRAVAWAISSF